MNKLKRVVVGALFAPVLMLASFAAEAESAPAPAPAPAAAAPKPSTPSTPSAPAAGAGSAWNAEVAPANSGNGMTLDAHQTQIVDKVSGYFSALGSLKGRFLQTGADNKTMKGDFYVKRPGRFRFDYARPSRQIVVSDGRYLAIQDLDLNNEDRVALDETPFRLLLRSDVNLIRDARIMEVQEADDMIVVGIEDKDPNTPGQIRVFLSTKPALELKEWVTRDAQGMKTRVQVSDLSKSDDLDGELFKIKAIGKPMGSP